jgi:uncharacterized membrane protein YqaE (UPF0057 family)
MKKLIALIAVIGIVFSSCNGKYTIAKRKYNKGFYIAKSGSTNSKPTVSPKANVVNAPEEKVGSVVVSKSVEAPVALPTEISSVKEAVSNHLKANSAPVQRNKTAPIASNSKNNYAPANEVKAIEISKEAAKAEKSGKGSDTNIVLLVILCILGPLNLIAVYLHDGKITTNFWLTLLLDVLFFIPGLIFSLLVVFDVVDLS